MTASRRSSGSASMVVCRWTSCASDAPARARAALRFVLTHLGYEAEAISDTVLAASELVANATEHAIGPYEMRLRRTPAEVICEVVDHDPRIPDVPGRPTAALFEPDPDGRGGGLDALCALLSERGRGLQIVDELTRGAWGFRCPGDGTKVGWLALPKAAPPGRKVHSRG
ncbi:ATP-binding protein [Streptomyces sp. NPDC050095]|uniref:ATP-binding protein n=1 Tax=unclassified Streptomyces TaxID=2593676 RepID=UPI00344682BC